MTTENHAEQQARAQVASVCAMVAALECDWDRLEELRDDCAEVLELRGECLRLRQAQCQEGASKGVTDALVAFELEHGDRLRELEDEMSSEVEELAELEEAAGDYDDREDAERAIDEDPLSVEVRSGWGSPGDSLDPEEYRIVLCTGGPHVELVGDLDHHGEPCSVRVQYRDWGTSGELFDFDHEAVLTYCRQHGLGSY
ncbi:hypothetical protein [Rhizobacter sp. Root1221]|uniref:hypothetical protein n=1 Tax=Rhizobacter sp. Root1221 TaxID=1736433 RepID=UPI0006F236A6|nr:hypothetical protein [Rhizobacter sp. Root1221]KQV99950.1 hypothetical protein ASC87_19815 [Rhizobacter sp. Root1221]